MADTISAALSNLQSIKSGDDPRTTTVSDGGSRTSIIDMVITYTDVNNHSLDDVYDSAISINSSGERMEYFVKDLLADSLDKETADEKTKAHKKCLSWLGSQNHPPDLMIRGAEAIEVKKSRGKHSKLQLNSSTPRTTLRSSMNRVTEDCSSCEDDIGGWDEKDMVYVLGSRVTGNDVGFIWVVYGECFCDDTEVYENVTDTLENAIKESPPTNGNLDLSGNEIAKVKDVGDGMYTEHRVRPMWSIEHPAKKFSEYVDSYDKKLDNGTPLFLVLPERKFKQVDASKKQILRQSNSVTITHVDSEGCYIIESQ